MARKLLVTKSLRGRYKNGLVALAFMAAYSISAVVPFMAGATVFADSTNTAARQPVPLAGQNDTSDTENGDTSDNLTENTSSDGVHAGQPNENESTSGPVSTSEDSTTTQLPEAAAQRIPQILQRAEQRVGQVEDQTNNAHRLPMSQDTDRGCGGIVLEGHPTCGGTLGRAHVQTHRTPVCGPNNDEVWQTGDHYRVASDTGWVANRRVLTYLPDAGYMFGSSREYTVTLKDDNTSCSPGDEDHHTIPIPKIWQREVCGPDNDFIVAKPSKYTVKSDTGWVDNSRTIEYEANEGYVFADGQATYTVTLTDENMPCHSGGDNGGGDNGGGDTPIVIAAPAGSVNEVCGPNNDAIMIPEGHYTITADTQWANNQRTVTLTAQTGYVFEGNKTTATLEFTDHNVACPGEVLGVTTQTPSNPLVVTSSVQTTQSAPRLLGTATWAGGRGAGQLEDTGTRLLTTIALSIGAIILAVLTMTDFSIVRRIGDKTSRAGRVARRRFSLVKLHVIERSNMTLQRLRNWINLFAMMQWRVA